MSQQAAIQIDPDIETRNLDALRQVDPNLAQRLTDLPDGTQRTTPDPIPVQTRDEQLSLRIVDNAGNASWLGRSSIPLVRAEALLAQFDVGPANVLVPTIGHGTVVRLMTERLAHNRAVFAWETDATALRLALRIHDLHDAIIDRRLILLLCTEDELPSALYQYLDSLPGHLSPSRIFMWPWQNVMGLNTCRAAIEAAGSQAEQTRQQKIKDLLATLATPSDKPHVCVFAMRHDRQSQPLINALAKSAEQHAWRWTDLSIQTPADVHPLSRLTKLSTQGRPAWSLLLDTTRQEVSNVLPADIPAVTWLTQPLQNAPQLAENDALAVMSPYARQQLIEQGVAADRVTVIPPCCLLSGETREDVPTPSVRPTDVLILADLPSTKAADYGHQLNSHVSIWNETLTVIGSKLDTFTAKDTEQCLAAGERKAGATIDDSKLRAQFVSQLGTAAANGLLWQYLAQALIDQGIRCDVHGRGWPASIPSSSWPADMGETLRRAKIVIHADTTGAISPWTLTAAAYGSAILIRRHPLDTEAAGTSSLFRTNAEYLPFDSAAQLIEQARSLLADDARLASFAAAGRARALSDHVPHIRMTALSAAASSYSTA